VGTEPRALLAELAALVAARPSQKDDYSRV